MVQFAPLLLAEKYHGIAIIWEHRFYGSSRPFEIDNTTGLALAGYDAYKYLTNEQALEDAVYFATNFSPSGYGMEAAESLRADKAPWIWIGGSTYLLFQRLFVVFQILTRSHPSLRTISFCGCDR